jgi:wyosine [tRNA(Phe)-imidazoG37] synthetase (radical SAM superfamily)
LVSEDELVAFATVIVSWNVAEPAPNGFVEAIAAVNPAEIVVAGIARPFSSST